MRWFWLCGRLCEHLGLSVSAKALANNVDGNESERSANAEEPTGSG